MTLPRTLSWAVSLLWIEAVGMAAVAGFLAIADLTGEAASLTAAVALTAFTVAAAVVIGLLARALGRGRRGARAPAIFVQLMLLPVGYFLITSDQTLPGAVVIAVAVGTGALLLARASREALGIE